VALAADFSTQTFLCRSHFPLVTAGTGYFCGFVVRRVNIGFHINFFFLSNLA